MIKDQYGAEKGCGTFPIHHVCWAAIFSGAFVGIGLSFLLHLYGNAISLSVFSASGNGTNVIAIGGLLGLLIGIIASMAAAGFVSGYLGRFHYYPVHGGIIYGFITWSLIIFLSAIMMGPMGNFVSAYGNSLSHSTSISAANIAETKAATEDLSSDNQKQENKAPGDVTSKDLAWGGWITFILFFVGALSSCVGACYGIGCRREVSEPSVRM